MPDYVYNEAKYVAHCCVVLKCCFWRRNLVCIANTKLHQKGTCINSESYRSAGWPETYRLNSPICSELNTDCVSRLRYLTAEFSCLPPFQVQPSRIRNRVFYLTLSRFIYRHNSPFVVSSCFSHSMDSETSGLRLHNASPGTVDAERAVAPTAAN